MFKLDNDTSAYITPINATHIKTTVLVHRQKENGKSTAIIAMPFFEGQHCHNNKNSRSNSPFQTWRVLLDSGSDGDLVFQQKGAKSNTSIPYIYQRDVVQEWRTAHGIFRTVKKGDLEITFPEYSRSKRFQISPDVVEYEEGEKPAFDLILGTDTMEKLGVVLDFKDTCITIDEIALPMRSLKNIQTENSRYKIWQSTNYVEPVVTEEATRRVIEILDAKYEKADLPKIVETECTHLTRNQRVMLLQLLQEFEGLFDGTLGDWKTSPVHLELKEGIKPYHGKAYPVPHIHKPVLRKKWIDWNI